MKPLELPLAEMTAREKLRAIETIWEDLTRNERQMKSPDWHFDELKEREQRRKSAKRRRSIGTRQKKKLRRRYS